MIVTVHPKIGECRRLLVGAVLAASAVCLAGCGAASDPPSTGSTTVSLTGPGYPVLSVADGDTITVAIDGVDQRVRLIGIDAPELHNPEECFGQESAEYARAVLAGGMVQLVADPGQGDRDRYGRLLRYVLLPDGTNVNAALVASGYAYEYTYDDPYRYQDLFREDERSARSGAAGLWSAAACGGQRLPQGAAATTTLAASSSPAADPPAGCVIKGNINSKGDRIFHVPGDASYPDTVVTAARGERYFCSEADAIAAGWRPAKN